MEEGYEIEINVPVAQLYDCTYVPRSWWPDMVVDCNVLPDNSLLFASALTPHIQDIICTSAGAQQQKKLNHLLN
jgi:hypothetical protein